MFYNQGMRNVNLFIEKQKVINAFGGVSQIANAYGVTRHAIYMWPEVISGARALRVKCIASATNVNINPAIVNADKVTPEQLKRARFGKKQPNQPMKAGNE